MGDGVVFADDIHLGDTLRQHLAVIQSEMTPPASLAEVPPGVDRLPETPVPMGVALASSIARTAIS
jgi:hypothetical protein